MVRYRFQYLSNGFWLINDGSSRKRLSRSVLWAVRSVRNTNLSREGCRRIEAEHKRMVEERARAWFVQHTRGSEARRWQRSSRRQQGRQCTVCALAGDAEDSNACATRARANRIDRATPCSSQGHSAACSLNSCEGQPTSC